MKDQMKDLQKLEIDLRRTIVGDRLREWRQEKSLSQTEVSTRLGYSSPQFISNWERGLSLPPMDVLPRLMGFYDVTPAELADVIYTYQEKSLHLQHAKLKSLLESELDSGSRR